MKYNNQSDVECIPLLRGGGVVSGLCSSMGGSLKETRLMAMLGYLIALDPQPFLNLFLIEGAIQSVALETRHAEGRSDILIETTQGIGVIEAKVDGTNPCKQSMKYPARWRVLITQYIPSNSEKSQKNIRFLQWHDIGVLLADLAVSYDPKVKFLSNDIKLYLEEFHMIKTKDSVEVYAREINGPDTLVLFLQGQLYGCHYEKNSRLSEALYFAPHFGQKVANLYPGIRVGISYIARIETIEMVETYGDLKKIVQKNRGKNWLNKNSNILNAIRTGWVWDGRTRSILFLGTPRLAFNPPVKKDGLQKGKGWLSKRFLSFDDLFAAWEGKNNND